MIETPKVNAYADEKGFLHMWCEYCQKWHHHGKPEGHRVKHCYCVGSPYEESGYDLVYVGPWTKELRKQYRNKKAIQCGVCHVFISPKPPIRCPQCGWTRKSKTKR